MTAMDVEKPRYYDGQYLSAADLTAAVQYSADRDARHMLGAHTWGIAAGLQLQYVTKPDGSITACVRPGYAWDGFGRPVVVLNPAPISPAMFANIAYDPAQPQGVQVKVWLAYEEQETQPPQPGFGTCDGTDQTARIVETFQIQIGERPNPADRRDPIMVNGQSIDAADAYDNFVATDGSLKDASVPFQEFPEDGDASKWLIPVGIVRWVPSQVNGQAGAFGQYTGTDEADSRKFRRYIGVVCQGLLACDDHISVKNRTQDDTATANRGDDLLRVDGGLRARGDVRIWGTTIDFRDTNGNENNIPLTLRRSDDPTTGSALDLSLGSGTGTVRFGIGPLNTSTQAVTENFVVLSDGSVGVGTATPDQKITVKGSGGAFIDVKSDSVTLKLGADSTGGILSTETKNDLLLGTNNTTYVAVKTDGKVGVNTTTPDYQLHVMGDRVRVEGGGKHIELCTDGANVEVHSKSGNINLHSDAAAGSNSVLINPGPLDGPVGIGTSTQSLTQKLTVGSGTLLLSNENPLLVDSVHTGFPNAATNQAEISNDTNLYKGLMIVGNRSAGLSSPGLGRKVIVYDILEVNGNSNVIGSLTVTQGCTVQSGLTVQQNADVEGDLTVVGGIINFSDAKIKSDVKRIDSALERLLRLRGVSYHTKDVPETPIRAGKHMGFIAQEVESVFPDWVSTSRWGYKQMRTDCLPAVIVEAIRDLHKENQELRAQVASLQNKVAGPRQASPTSRAPTSRKKRKR